MRQTDRPALRLGALSETPLREPQRAQHLALIALRHHSLARPQQAPHYHLARTAQERKLRETPAKYQQS